VAVDKIRAGAGYLDGVLVAGYFDDEEASEDLLRLAEGAFGDYDIAVLGAKTAAGSVDELLAASVNVALNEAVTPGDVFGEERLDLLGG
jgi:hypothetical protein